MGTPAGVSALTRPVPNRLLACWRKDFPHRARLADLGLGVMPIHSLGRAVNSGELRSLEPAYLASLNDVEFRRLRHVGSGTVRELRAALRRAPAQASQEETDCLMAWLRRIGVEEPGD